MPDSKLVTIEFNFDLAVTYSCNFEPYSFFKALKSAVACCCTVCEIQTVLKSIANEVSRDFMCLIVCTQVAHLTQAYYRGLPIYFEGFSCFENIKTLLRKNKKADTLVPASLCGGRGIRTPGPVTVNSFQDCRNRPLCHSSCELSLCGCKYKQPFLFPMNYSNKKMWFFRRNF